MEVYLYSLLCLNGLRPSTESTVCVFFLVMKVVDGFTKFDCLNYWEGKEVQIYSLNGSVIWLAMVEIGLLKTL